MLMPRKTKFRRHHRGHRRGTSRGQTTVQFGEYGLKSLEAGWVTNRADGAVEAVFEGPPEAVAAMVEFCESGPRGAYVDRVELVDEQPEGLNGFDVR